MKEHKPIVLLSQRLSFELIAVHDPIDEITITYIQNTDGTFDLAISPRQMSITYRLMHTHAAEMVSELISYQGVRSNTVSAESVGPESATYQFSTTLLHARIHESPRPPKYYSDISKPLLSDGTLSVFPRSPSSRPFFIGFTTTTTVYAPDGFHFASKVYSLYASTSTPSSTVPLRVKIGYTEKDSLSRSWYAYDANSGWHILTSYNHVENNTVEASVDIPSQPIALLAKDGVHDGIASWYSYRNCLCAASTVYPKGTLLKVTRLKTGNEVIVRVNDYGPEKTTGRIIDLDKRAFKKIGSLGAGLVYVRVEPYTNL